MSDTIKLCHLDVGCIAYESCDSGTCVVREAIAAERSECAKIARELPSKIGFTGDRLFYSIDVGSAIAAAIRARGQT